MLIAALEVERANYCDVHKKFDEGGKADCSTDAHGCAACHEQGAFLLGTKVPVSPSMDTESLAHTVAFIDDYRTRNGTVGVMDGDGCSRATAAIECTAKL